MAIYTKAELEKQKESLTAKLKEVTDQLDKFDETIYKGKLEKAIRLLDEVHNYLNYPTINLECPECGSSIEFDLEYIIDGLENLCKGELREND